MLLAFAYVINVSRLDAYDAQDYPLESLNTASMLKGLMPRFAADIKVVDGAIESVFVLKAWLDLKHSVLILTKFILRGTL